MEKKNIHIISHTHWDREWYMPFEAHRYKLVEFFDRLLHTLDTDPTFKSFHLDGQAIVIEEKLFGDCFETEDQKAGMGNFLEKDKEKKLKVVPFKNC